MAYTRGNLAVQERQKQRQTSYVEKTKVVKRRSQLPKREKMLYLMSVLVVVAVMGWVGMSHVKLYELNRQIQLTESQMNTGLKEIDVLQVKKQTLEMEIVQKARELGYVQAEQDEAIHVPPVNETTETSGMASGN